MIPYFFMEVECIGNTQIIHMEETEITQRTIGLWIGHQFHTPSMIATIEIAHRRTYI